MPEHLECEVLQKVRYINTLTFTFYVKTVTATIMKLSGHITNGTGSCISPLV